MFVRRILLLAFLTALSSGSTYAQSVRVARYTVEDGLAQNHVTAIAQDETGYLWVGTARGVQRFDGYHFLPLTTLYPQAPRELDGPVTTLLIDRRGRHWIVTPRTLLWGRLGSGTMQRLSIAGAVAADSTGRLWVANGTGGLSSIDWQAESPRVTVAAASLANCCKLVATTRQGEVWAVPHGATSGTVLRIDPATGSVRTYAVPLLDLTSIAEDAHGQLWLAGYSGAFVLAQDDNRFREVPALRGREIGDLVADARDGVILATDRWIARADRAGNVVERWQAGSSVGAAPLLASEIMIDRQGLLWLGTLAAGLLRFDVRPPLFDHVSSATIPALDSASNFIMSLHELNDGTLWTGTLGGGAFRLQDRWSVLQRFSAAPDSAASTGNVWAFETDRSGDLWTATSQGICLLKPDGSACFLENTGVNAIARDTEGWFWLALGEGGVQSFEPQTRRVGPRLEAGWSIMLYADPHTRELWIGGAELLRAPIANGRIVQAPRKVTADVAVGEPAFQLMRDSRGILWLASHRGLQQWDEPTQRFRTVSTPELRATAVFSIAEDLQGRLWLGTSHGIVQYSPPTGLARRYRRQDGVMSGEFNRRAALRRRNGEMVFGGLHGLTVFRPEAVNEPHMPSPIVFTRWRRVSSDGGAEANVPDDARVRIGPRDHAFSIQFASLNFAAAPSPRYRYRLAGLSNEWVETSDNGATYATPPPGVYTFEVQSAAGFEGAWTPAISMAVQVIPPLWRTDWFKLTALIAALLLLWQMHRMRVARLMETERLRSRISRDLHDEIGAGLSSIALLSDVITAGLENRRQLDRIGRSAREMAADLRDIVWAVDPDSDRLGNVVSRMQDVAADLLAGVHVNFRAPGPAALMERTGMAVRRDLLRIYKEVLHNIARHAQASVVDIQLNAHKDGFELIISDDGIGFEADRVRAGVGLKSMRERAERMDCNLAFSRAPGGGTEVRLYLRKT